MPLAVSSPSNGPYLLRLLVTLIPQALKGAQSSSVLFADPPTPFTLFLCLNSMCSTRTVCGREPRCFHVSFHGTALCPIHAWPCIPATLGTAPAAPHGPVISSWPAPGVAGFPRDALGGKRCWSWLQWDWGLQHHCPGRVRSGASRARPDSDLGPHSGPTQLECSRNPPWGCCVSCTPILGSLCGGARYAHPGRWGHPGCRERLAPRPSS